MATAFILHDIKHFVLCVLVRFLIVEPILILHGTSFSLSFCFIFVLV